MSKVQPSHAIYPDWHFQPIRLEKNQMKNPVIVFREFFEMQNLSQARQNFKEMLNDAISNVDAYAIDHLTFYYDVEKLIEAAWLILQQHENNTTEPPTIKATEDESFTAILQLMIAAINPDRIFILGKQDKQLIDLLIIVPDRDARPFKHYETIISTLFYTITDFSFSLHTISSVQEQLTAGSPFYLYACTPGKEVYAANNAIPLSILQPSKEKSEERQTSWTITQAKANAFFECAKHCFESKNHATALFMLHQSAELSLYGLINTLWGREIKDHSLTILYRHLGRLHNPGLDLLLSPSTVEEKDRLQLLESAYLKARYNNSFQPDRDKVIQLLQWTLELVDACEDVANLLLGYRDEK